MNAQHTNIDIYIAYSACLVIHTFFVLIYFITVHHKTLLFSNAVIPFRKTLLLIKIKFVHEWELSGEALSIVISFSSVVPAAYNIKGAKYSFHLKSNFIISKCHCFLANVAIIILNCLIIYQDKPKSNCVTSKFILLEIICPRAVLFMKILTTDLISYLRKYSSNTYMHMLWQTHFRQIDFVHSRFHFQITSNTAAPSSNVYWNTGSFVQLISCYKIQEKTYL